MMDFIGNMTTWAIPIGIIIVLSMGFTIVFILVTTKMESDNGRKPEPVVCDGHWLDLALAIVILVVGLAVVDLVTHSTASYQLQPTISPSMGIDHVKR